MADARLYITEVASGLAQGLPTCQVVQIPLSSSDTERPLLGPGTFRTRQVDPVTGRGEGNLLWSLRFPGLQDHRSVPLTSQQVLAKLRGWKNRQLELTLSGPDFLALAGESLRRETTGTYANKRFWSTYPWWASGASIYADSVLQSSGYTIDTTWGYVTFTSAVGAAVDITATGARNPRVRVHGPLDVQIVRNTAPQTYDITAVFREVTPA